MNKSSKSITKLLALGFSLLLVAPVIAQDYDPSEERSDFDQRKISIMDGNRMRATYHNTGHAGRRTNSSLNELLFEFPRNTNREYMYFMSVMFGTEVPQQNTNNPAESFPMVDVSAYRTNRTGTQNWSLNPIEGYARDDSDELARSDRGPISSLGNTWPDSWPDKFEDGGDGWAGSWNGFFGRDQFNADVEFYYKAGDDLYTRFVNGSDDDDNVFRPDDTDPTRGGMGIILDTRIMAWSQRLVSTTHFNIFEIKNDGNYDYPRMAFGLWIADFVDGGGPTNEPLFDNIQAIAYLTDTARDEAGEAFGDGLIGEMGLKFIETPGNSIDGIDNDGDADNYDPLSQYRIADKEDLFTPLTDVGGGFYTREFIADTLIRIFEAEDFLERVINIGDKIVRILDDNSRVIDTYTGDPFVSQGVTWDFGGTIRVTENNLPQTDPDFGIHIDGLDSDFDGLIDENAPNHLTKNTFDPFSGTFIPRAVRFINYLEYEVGDTLGRGMVVPNQLIRSRISSDADFADLVNNQYQGRLQNYFTSAPMLDEGRDDFFDNDNDWNPLIDDVGIQGDENVLSAGQGDGLPSSGEGTTFPGEPSIDKTDVSETDLIGVSKVRIFDAGALQVNQDGDIWTNYLTPGEFLDTPGTDSDIYVSSGLFPLDSGSIQRFAVAITAAQENGTARQDRDKVNERLVDATTAYEADYQFAVAPSPPILTAVAGDGKVTLYWDTSSEESLDRYIKLQTGDGKDFEGYKVYRTTDVSFEEIRSITDGSGSATFLRPLAIYDLKNGLSDFHPVADDGLQFDLGNDTGLQRFFEDTDVVNGRKYYYAVSAYDRGFTEGEISPSESPVQISLNPDGTVILGQNVVEVRPSEEAAGYISPENPFAQIINGSPGGTVSVDIIDPRELKANNIYDVVFEDTIRVNPTGPDTLTTKNFTLRNITSGEPDTLISRSTQIDGGNNPVVEGFAITLDNIEETGIDDDRTGWTFSTETLPHNHEIFTLGPPKISDYDIIIGDNVGFGQSVDKVVETSPGTFTNLASVSTNFRIFNTYLNEEVSYAFLDLQSPTSSQQRCNPTFFPPDGYDPAQLEAGQLSAVSSLSGRCSDLIYLVEDFREVVDTVTYRITMSPFLSEGALITRNPEPGDTLKIFTNKPFISTDRFQFTFDEENIPRIDADTARSELDDILVIPNPYKVANIYEAAVTATNRQHNRELHFTKMPAPSTLRIFTVAGVLIREIDIQPSDLVNGYGGTYIWDMLTKDNLEISYGIYLYQVEAPGVGEKVGKFAVIK